MQKKKTRADSNVVNKEKKKISPSGKNAGAKMENKKKLKVKDPAVTSPNATPLNVAISSPLIRRFSDAFGDAFSEEEIAYYSSWAKFTPPNMETITKLTAEDRYLLCGVAPGSDQAVLFQDFEKQLSKRFVTAQATKEGSEQPKAKSWPAIKSRLENMWVPLLVPDSIIGAVPSSSDGAAPVGTAKYGNIPSPNTLPSGGRLAPSAATIASSNEDFEADSNYPGSTVDGSVNGSAPPWVRNTNISRDPRQGRDLRMFSSDGYSGETPLSNSTSDDVKDYGQKPVGKEKGEVGTNTIFRKFNDLEEDLEELKSPSRQQRRRSSARSNGTNVSAPTSPGAKKKKADRGKDNDSVDKEEGSKRAVGPNTINNKLNALEEDLDEMAAGTPRKSPRSRRPSAQQMRQGAVVNSYFSQQDGKDKKAPKKKQKTKEKLPNFLPDGRVVVLSLGPIPHPYSQKVRASSLDPSKSPKRKDSENLPPLSKKKPQNTL